MMLGHGSGIPICRALMAQMAESLANQRIVTFHYNYPYSEGMTTYSPDKIDSLEVLMATPSLAKSAVVDLFLALTREHWPDVRGMVLYVFPMRWHNLPGNPVSHPHRVPGAVQSVPDADAQQT